MRFKSKIDGWMHVILWFTIILMIGTVFIIPKEERLIGYLFSTVFTLFILWIYMGTYYELKDDYLFCKSGPFFEKIKYENIRSIKPSNNLLSSMALSVHRIEIRQHGKGYIMGTTYISPINQDEFIQLLETKCDNLE